MTRNQFLFNSAICFIAGMACAGFGIHHQFARETLAFRPGRMSNQSESSMGTQIMGWYVMGAQA